MMAAFHLQNRQHQRNLYVASPLLWTCTLQYSMGALKATAFDTHRSSTYLCS